MGVKLNEGLQKRNGKKIIFIISLSIVLFSCGKIDLFEKQAAIPKSEWFYNNVPEFTFHIEDTTAMYNMYVIVRHTDQYDFNNIWLRIGTQFPSDSMRFQNINLTLGSDQKGWEGIGMDDIFEVRSAISPGPVSFKKAGNYTFSLGQIMRENPLEHVMNIGFRVEKASH